MTRFWFVLYYYSNDLKALISQNILHSNGLEFATILVHLMTYIVYFEFHHSELTFETSLYLLMEPTLNITTDNQVSLSWTH